MKHQLRLPNTTDCVPGGFQYVIPDFPANEAKIGPVTSIQQCIAETMQRYSANARLVPSNIRDLIEQQNCERQAPGYCQWENGLSSSKPYRMTVVQLLTGTITLGSWLITGGKTVEQDKANERAGICASCTKFNQKPEGCSGCKLGDIFATITGIIKDKKTPHDEKLNGCLVCSCSQRVKVWAPIDLLKRFMSADTLNEFPDWCWVKNEARQ